MKKTLWISASLMAGASAMGAMVFPVGINGSDTLRGVLTDALVDCNIDLLNGAQYLGGGCTAGGAAMRDLEQEIAGMSRLLRARSLTQDVCAHPEDGLNAEGIVFALDGVRVGTEFARAVRARTSRAARAAPARAPASSTS